MVTTVRLTHELEEILKSLSTRLNKKKSDVIREAIRHYAKDLEQTQNSRIRSAMQKTMASDFKEYKSYDTSINDGL